MKINDIIFKTKISDYFYVVTRYKGKGEKDTERQGGGGGDDNIPHSPIESKGVN